MMHQIYQRSDRIWIFFDLSQKVLFRSSCNFWYQIIASEKAFKDSRGRLREKRGLDGVEGLGAPILDNFGAGRY